MRAQTVMSSKAEMSAKADRTRARAMTAGERARERRRESARCIRPVPPALALLLAALGGACAWAAFPPHDLWPFLPIGIALLLAACLAQRVLVAASAGLLWGMAFFLPLTAWANVYAGAPPWIALAIAESLFIVVFALTAHAVLRRWGLTVRSGAVVALLWAGIEALRSHVPWGGFPWGATAFALQDAPLLTLGPWIGMTGLAVAVAVIALLLLAGVCAVLGGIRSVSRARGLWALAGAALLVLACIVVPRPHNPAPEGAGSLRIAGIQGNVPRIAAQDLAMPREILPNSLRLTGQAADEARASGKRLDLVVWPEASAGWDPREDAATGDALRAASEDATAPVLIGTATDSPDDRIYNMSQLWTADGDPQQTYAKRHPVPFGEYIPARSFFRTLSDKVDLVPTDMAPGDAVGVMTLGERRVGVLICFEIAYENLVQDVVDADAEVIVVQTNTALFGESDEAAQQLGEARVLSSISGRSIVQVSTVGESAIITPDGRMLAHAGHWEPGIVVADVPLRTGTTPAMSAGPWPAILAGILGTGGLIAALSSSRSSAPRPSRRRRSS